MSREKQKEVPSHPDMGEKRTPDGLPLRGVWIITPRLPRVTLPAGRD